MDLLYYFLQFYIQAPVEKSFCEPQIIPRFSGKKRQATQNKKVFYYVPLLETLKSILVKPEVVSEVCSPSNTDGSLRDFRDGLSVQANDSFSVNPQQLQIIALGSYSKKHKLSCLFFTLGNICPCKRSTLKAIYLVAVAKCEDVVKFGIDNFCSPL